MMATRHQIESLPLSSLAINGAGISASNPRGADIGKHILATVLCGFRVSAVR